MLMVIVSFLFSVQTIYGPLTGHLAVIPPDFCDDLIYNYMVVPTCNGFEVQKRYVRQTLYPHNPWPHEHTAPFLFISCSKRKTDGAFVIEAKCDPMNMYLWSSIFDYNYGVSK